AYPQQVSLHLGRVPLKTAFDEITKQTGVFLIYSNDEIDVRSRVEANVEHLDVVEAVARLVGDDYTLRRVAADRIVISPRKIDPHAATNQQSVRGTVTDPQGRPIGGATVTVAGKSGGTQTDENGQFTVIASAGDKLSISILGYQTVS